MLSIQRLHLPNSGFSPTRHLRDTQRSWEYLLDLAWWREPILFNFLVPKTSNPITRQIFDAAIYPPLATPGEATPLPARSYNGVLQDITHNEYAASGNTLNFDFTDIYESSLPYASSVPRSHANAVAIASYSSSSTQDALQQYTPSTSSAPSPTSSQHVSQHLQIRRYALTKPSCPAVLHQVVPTIDIDSRCLVFLSLMLSDKWYRAPFSQLHSKSNPCSLLQSYKT
ncbi:hypothetical protein DL96DRAFT_1764509 [Flagelloscypha sp. PMI_526]|nr:hypothetical protein DL96DRAFT_1764509 [Flagelloscypha sp. PMI_526]